VKFYFTYRLLLGHLRTFSIRLLLAALIIGIAGLTTVTFLSERLKQSILLEAHQLLGADLILSSSQPIDPKWQKQAVDDDLQTSSVSLFLSMLSVGDILQLASIKAVDEDYPLRGNLRIKNSVTSLEDKIAKGVPLPGTIWMDARLLSAMQLRLGDSVRLGDATLHVSAILTGEPDPISDFLSISPRALINVADLAQTKVIQPGSRVTYQLLVAGHRNNINEWRLAVEPHLNADEKIQTLEQSQPRVEHNVLRVQKYMNLSAIGCLLLVSIAIALAAQQYSQKQIETCAMLRCLGAKTSRISGLYLRMLSIIALIGVIIGGAIGYGGQMLLGYFLATVFSITLPVATYTPFLIALLAGFLLLAGFALPPLWQLRNVSPLQALYRRGQAMPTKQLFIYGFAVAAIFGLVVLLTNDVMLALMVLAIISIGICALSVVTYLVLAAIASLRWKLSPAWRMALAHILWRARSNTLQIIASGLVITLFLLVGMVRNDVLHQWENKLAPDAPNHFAFNIQPGEELQSFQNYLDEHKVTRTDLYPMVRARLVEINGKPVSIEDFPGEKPHSALTRDLNVTQTTSMPTDNKILEGTPLQNSSGNGNLISVEKTMADSLHLKLGDTLTFTVADQQLFGVISSVRSVEWDSFHPNFFVIFSPDSWSNLPTTYVTSFYLPEYKKVLLNNLLQKFPTVFVIEIDKLMQNLTDLFDKISIGINGIFIFIFIAALLVLVTILYFHYNERYQETAVLRTLGASKRQLLHGILAEFFTIGLLSGALGGCMAMLGSFLLTTQWLGLAYSPNFLILGVAVLAGVTVQIVMAYFASRRLLRSSVVKLQYDYS